MNVETEWVGIGEREGAVIEMLRARTFAPIPRFVLGPTGIAKLRDAGLIERALVTGYWQLTAEGKLADVDALKARQRPHRAPAGNGIPAEPAGEARRVLAEAWGQIDHLRPGGRLFGAQVRKASLDHLAGKDRARKFIYFAYPIGFPLKHIAWATQTDWPRWTELVVSIERNKLGLPATRYKTQWQRFRDRHASESDLRQRLIDEGCTEEEVLEYFAAAKDGAVVL